MVQQLLSDKTLKAKEKVAVLAERLLDGSISVAELVKVAAAAKDADKGNCIEALEYATKTNPELADASCLALVTASLTSKAARVQWESAKVIGNTARRFPGLLDEAVVKLLANTEHTGTVVRWSAAFALGEIVQLPHPRSAELALALEAIAAREEKNSIRKLYAAALKARHRSDAMHRVV